MVAQRVARSPVPNPNIRTEGARPGSFLISFHHEKHCHENATLYGTGDGVPTNSVLVNVDGSFRGIVYEGVRAGETALRALLVRGPAEVSAAELNWPTAADGPDADADPEAETAALKLSVIADMNAAGIVVRN